MEPWRIALRRRTVPPRLDVVATSEFRGDDRFARCQQVGYLSSSGVRVPAPDQPTAFDDDFRRAYSALYDAYDLSHFKPALNSLNTALRDLVSKKFDPTDATYLRVEGGRVKSKWRLYEKAQRPEYVVDIAEPDDVFHNIVDIVGTRITCNTIADVRCFANELALICRGKRASLRSVKGLTARDFIINPKESGYRAYHMNVTVDVPVSGRLEPWTCEVQIRTLLQDAWGELTHEDTYKPGMAVPDLVVSLSRRLAGVLSVMDELAQDIRDELDRWSRRDFPATSRIASLEMSVPDTREAVSQLTPVELAKEVLADVEQETREFDNRYISGERLIGSPVYVGWDYALVRLNDDVTGILHWRHIPAKGQQYIDVRDHVVLGVPIEVEIITVDAQRHRIELALARS
jgi:ppGpp synthetase/RelA/SpoT-type nucleotidyltranferase